MVPFLNSYLNFKGMFLLEMSGRAATAVTWEGKVLHVRRNIPARLITSTTNLNSPASYTLWHPRASGGFNYNGSESSACSSEGCAARDRLDAVSAPRASASTRVFLSRQWVPSPPRYSGLKYCPCGIKPSHPLLEHPGHSNLVSRC